MNIFRFLIFIFCLSAYTSSMADTYSVGIKEAKPFAYQEDGVWKGYSVELLDRIAKDVGFEYKLVKGNTISDIIGMVESGETDMSISAISMTDEREKKIDFSHPYFTTTQGILVKENGNVVGWIAQRVGIAFAGLVALMYIIGFFVARADRDDAIDNVHKGAWFALVTFTTTGYGDYVPDNARSKSLAALWMIASLFLLSIFTGYIASSLTVKKLTEEPTTIQSLFNSDVITLEGTTSQNTLSSLGIQHNTVPTLSKGIDKINNDEADALIYDKAMLDFIAISSDDAPYAVWPINQGQERYAIAFPEHGDDDLQEAINISILDIIDSSSWKNINVKYFGE